MNGRFAAHGRPAAHGRGRLPMHGQFVALAAGALLLSGCMPAAATEQGQRIHDLYLVFIAVAAVVATVVWGLVTWAILRYRKRSEELPPQFEHHVRLEIAWTAIPLLTVLGLFAVTLSTLGYIDAQAPSPAVRVEVTGFRWQWQFSYPDEGVTVVGTPDRPAELVIPVGEPVRFELTSADIIHSFYVPQFLFKRDANPGRTTSFDVTVTAPGEYRGQCAEFCGVFHDRMTLTVRAVPRSEFDAWLADQRGRP